jgi:hypothetical protein
MPRTFDVPDMPRLDVLDDEFGEDSAAGARVRRRRVAARILMFAALLLGLGAIGALAFAWSNAEGRLRFDLQSTTTPPKSAQRTAAEEEVERLRGQIEALQEDVKQLTEAQYQAAHTIAAAKASEQELRRQAPAPYWYSNPTALDPGLAKGAKWAGAVAAPRRPPTARSESRVLRERDTSPPSAPAAAR